MTSKEIHEQLYRQIQERITAASLRPCSWYTGAPRRAPVAVALRCECGSAACGSSAHADYCPLYEADQ